MHTPARSRSRVGLTLADLARRIVEEIEEQGAFRLRAGDDRRIAPSIVQIFVTGVRATSSSKPPAGSATTRASLVPRSAVARASQVQPAAATTRPRENGPPDCEPTDVEPLDDDDASP